jgi:hypothetical protein
MNPGGSQSLPLERNLQGIVTEDSFFIIITLKKADAFTVSQVYRWNDFDLISPGPDFILHYHRSLPFGKAGGFFPLSLL